MKARSIITFLFFCATLLAQDQKQPYNPSEPTMIFDLYWEAATPQSYTITVQASGKASYVSRNPTRPASPNQQPDPDYTLDFTISPATRDRMFLLAKAANYFQGKFDYTKHKVASTGKKTLTYADPTRHFDTVYDYTENPTVEEVTRIFQGISNTIEHGRKLQFLRRFDKLGLAKELAGMEELAQHGYMTEVQIIAPTLQNIANDSAVMNLARQSAQRLLAGVGH
jgi:hypothetical protein